MSDRTRSNKISAVIVSYNAPESLRLCIAAVAPQVDRIVVVDNSPAGVLSESGLLNEFKGMVIFIVNNSNLGLAHALNQGLHYSQEQGYGWSLLLDQDSRPSPDMVKEMLSSFEMLNPITREVTGIIVPTVLDSEHKNSVPPVITGKYFNQRLREPGRDCLVHYHITSGSLINNAILQKVGFMNSNLFIDCVDFDFCFRVLDQGMKILLSHRAVLHHTLGQSKEKFGFRFREHSPMRIYYQTRNGLYTAFKYVHRYPSFGYYEIFKVIMRPFKIIILESEKTAKLGMYLKGIAAFIKNRRRLEQGQ